MATNDRTTETETEEGENFARLSVTAKVGDGPDQRVKVKGTLQRGTLEEVRERQDELTEEVEEAALGAIVAITKVREDVLLADDGDD